MKIFCTGCNEKVEARLTNAGEIYPTRNDLKKLPFWICDTCKNYVGCHHKTSNPTQPLGCIPTPEIRTKRKIVHSGLDPLWKLHGFTRKEVYNAISGMLGYKYHTAEIRSVEEANKVIAFINRKYYGSNQKQQPTLNLVI